MDFATFWQRNELPPFETGYTAYSARYVGTLDDYAAYQPQIEAFFTRNANHRAQKLVGLTAVPDGDGFVVYGICR